MHLVTAVLKRKVLRRVAPIVFVAIAGVGLAACGSSGASGGSGAKHNSPTTTPTMAPTTTTPAGSGGAGF